MTKRSPRRPEIGRRTLLRTTFRAAIAAVVAGAGPVRSPRAAVEPGHPDALTPIDPRGIEARWGNASVAADGRGFVLPDGAYPLFPSVARLPASFPATGTAWTLALGFESLLASGERMFRRDVEDFAVSFGDGRVQLWLGGRRTPGLRLLVYGRQVAVANAFAEAAGRPNFLVVSVDAAGGVEATANAAGVVSAPAIFLDESLRGGGPIDLLSRNGPVRCFDAAGTNLADGPAPAASWRPRAGEPSWHPAEAIGNGYQPLKTHLFSRWTGQLRRTADDYAGIAAFADAGATLLTHGPVLGLPAQGRLGVMVRTARPAAARLRAGPGDDPAGWRVLGEFATRADAGNTGHATVGSDVFAPDETRLRYGIEVDGVLADTRADGAWPVLKRRWLDARHRETATIAVTHCDNFYPAVVPLQSPHWRRRAGDADLLVHLGDHVYEQGYRRRPEVSRLDYLDHFAPGAAQDRRGRLLPTVGLFDDHDLYNDVTGTGEVGPFARPTEPDGPQLPADMPWRIASRDVGRAVWEEWIGWGTPQDGPRAVVYGTGAVVDGVLKPHDFAPWDALDAAQIAALAPLCIWPDGAPTEAAAITPACAGSYRVAGLDRAGGGVLLAPRPAGAAAVSFGVSTPRYGSVVVGNAEILLIDTRTSRTFWRIDRLDPRATMLGARQRDWLLGRIRRSTADVLFVASSNTVTFANETDREALDKRDSWTGYEHERKMMLDALVARDGPAIFLTGDLHNTAVRRLDRNIHEVICGSWSNIGYPDIAGAMRPVAEFPDAALLWAGPSTSPDSDWGTWSTLFETDRSGGVALEVIDLAADRTIQRLRL